MNINIEIISPGCLPNHLTIEKMKSGVSCARNATIASFASKELPYRGLGTGVKRAIEVIPDIQFESDRDANWLKAVVRRTGKFETTDHAEKTVIGEDNAAFGGEKADIDKEKSAIRDSESFESRINDRHLTKPTATAIRKLRDSLGTTGLVSRSIVIQIVDLEKTRATELIALMHDMSIIEPVRGQGKGKYRFAL